MKRSRLTRKTRLKQRGKRAEREAEALAAFRAAVLERSARPGSSLYPIVHECERCLRWLPASRIDAHHRKPRGRSGTHDPKNGVALCNGPNGCHGKVTDHLVPDWKDWISDD